MEVGRGLIEGRRGAGSSASPSLRLAVLAADLVVAHLQLHLQHTPAQPVRYATTGQSSIGRGSVWSVVSQISSHAQKSLGSYALLAIAREPFELRSHLKSPSSVSRRELSIDLRWRASRPKPEFPAPEIETERRCAQGERCLKKERRQKSSSKVDGERSVTGQPPRGRWITYAL